MPRTARVVLANYPHHIIQRGHNRHVVFTSDEDYLYYLDNLREWKETLGCNVYTYCLMTNHVHLIIAPGDNKESLALLMKRVAGRQTRYVNKIEKRSGTLWEGRYKSSLISTDEYLLACCRYVEMNPVRAGLVADPREYPWSSYRCKIGEQDHSWLDYDPCYMELATTWEKRREKYADWVRATVGESEWNLIRQAIQRGQLTGSDRFVDEIEERIKKRIEIRGPGRPKKLTK